MPDVHFWYSPELLYCEGMFRITEQHRVNFAHVQTRIQYVTAQQMDCLDVKGQKIVHDPKTQIDILTFAPLARSSKLAVIRVDAYDWPDRMRNIDERLQTIGESVRQLLELPPDSMGISFGKLQHETEEQRGCWVKV